jgi:transcriptional regulator with PAS, ATPase and Fis domain
VYDLVARVAPPRATVFVTGQSGTGKGSSHTVHERSGRRDQADGAVNCSSDSALIEAAVRSERGSFTGASAGASAVRGRARRNGVPGPKPDADRLQVKLLRVLEAHAQAAWAPPT